ncbi:hypothetical protein [Brotaphodocola sp.]|uniref:hypothetical protein n=1 Tax=Brotaphodocola sp. TaxID=3073577 RepID=UPI003D7CD2EC
MYFITIKRMLEVCFSTHPNIQYRTDKKRNERCVQHTSFAPSKLEGLLQAFFIAFIMFLL